MKKRIKSLPRYLYVTKEIDGDDSYFIADTDLAAFEHGAVVAIYKLENVARKVVNHRLEPTKQ